MAKQKKSMIGLDPLAWLKEDAEDAEIVEEKNTKSKSKKKTTSKKKASKKSSKATPAKSENSDNVFTIQATQDISSVTTVHSELKELLTNEKVILDGGAVERIDGASLQLLYAFIVEAKNKNVEVSWSSVSDTLENSAKLLGMEDALGLKTAA